MSRSALLIVSLFSLSGVSALLYQFVWIRMLSHLLGGTSLAISSVLAAFMGGLALGSRYFGDRTDRSERPLRVYARLEIGIGVLGLLVPLLILRIRPLYAALAEDLPASGLPLLRIGVAAVLLLPPTFLMGGTLPVLSRFLVRRRERLGRGLGLLYAANTLGAVVGSFLAGFYLIEALGLGLCTGAAVVGNLAIGVLILGIDARGGAAERGGSSAVAAAAREPGRFSGAPPPSRCAPSPGGSGPPEIGPGLLAFAFGSSGFAALGFEIHWTRALQHFLGNSTYAYSAMLTTFLLGLTGGGWAGGILADRVRERVRLLAWTQIAVGAAVLSTVPLIWNLLPRLSGEAFLNPGRVEWSTFLLRRFLVAFTIMALPTFLLGMTFPLVNRAGIREMSRLGRGVGSFYFANTLGAILGSLAAGFLVLPWLGARGGILATASLSVAVGVVLHLGRRPRRLGECALAGVVALLLMGSTVPLDGAGRAILSDTQEPEDRVLLDIEDPIGATRVYEKGNGERHMSVDGHHIGGSSPGMLRKEMVLAHLPMALVPRAGRVLAVGLGSGITLGALAGYEEIEKLTCVEIVPGVARGAELFREQNHDVLRDPRVEIVLEDGVQFLLTTRERFDIISSDSKINPHYVGNAPLLARDYYELCRDHLTDAGVMVQWLPLHLPASVMRMVVRGFVEAFPHSALFWHYPYNVIQVGSLAPIEVDMERARRFSRDPDLRHDLEFLQLERPAAMASLFVTSGPGIRAAAGDGPLNTWMRPRLEFEVIRAHLRKPTFAHEDDNLRWLLRHRDYGGPQLRGTYDREELERFLFSSGKLLQGYSAGGGIARLETGRRAFEEGLARNPEDWRLRHILEVLDRKQAAR